MIEMPVAVFKVTWSDTPWINGRPVGIPYDDNLINHLYLPLERGWGVSGFWREASFGLINLERSEVFPWRKLEGIATPTAAMPVTREAVIEKIKAQATAEGWPLHKFKAFVVLIGPRNLFQDAGGWGNNCLVQVGDDHAFCAHEFGHAIGFEHTMGTNPRTGAFEAYNDKYCVMGEGVYSGPATAPPGAPPTGDGYWGGMAPLPSAAELCAFLAGFTNDTDHVVHAGALAADFSRTLRLRARDLHRGPDWPYPLAVVVDVPGSGVGSRLSLDPPAPPVSWMVELRRGAGWDNGIGKSGAPAAGLVVHSMRPIDEFPLDDTPDFRPRAVYEGVVPLDPANLIEQPYGFIPAADADGRFGGGVFAVRVEEVAQDLSWVEITVGGSRLGRDAAVTADFGRYDGLAAETFEEGLARDVPVFICGNGDYNYMLQRRAEKLRNSATASGFDTPIFRWKVNGVSIPVNTSPFILKPEISVAVISTFPQPNGSSMTGPRTATIAYEQAGSVLILTGDPEDGNYSIDIEVTASEGSVTAGSPASPVSVSKTVKMTGIQVTYEQRYYDDLERCIERVKGIDDRFSKSVKPGPRTHFSLEDSPNVRINMLDRIAESLVETGSPVLATQLENVAQVLRVGKSLRR